MSLPVHVHEAAETEIEEGADFYDVESPGLGDEFTAEIEHAIEHISRHPHAAPAARGALRAKTLMRFPYSLQFSGTSDEHDREIILYLVDVLLLHQPGAFPSDKTDPQERAVANWAQVGRAMLGDAPGST